MLLRFFYKGDIHVGINRYIKDQDSDSTPVFS